MQKGMLRQQEGKTLSVSVNLCQGIVKGFFLGDVMSIPLAFCARKLLLTEHRGRSYALLLNCLHSILR
jgi:hypothetical protein